MAAYATLDCTQKKCSDRLTDGEELKNRSISPSGHSILAFFLCAIKGMSLRDG